MLGLDNPLHILFVLVIVLLLFGAKRLPEMGQSLGAGLRGFKESINGETPAALRPAGSAGPVVSPEAAAVNPTAPSQTVQSAADLPVERAGLTPVR
jgi:sec-independent protein translocase protein TatA